MTNTFVQSKLLKGQRSFYIEASKCFKNASNYEMFLPKESCSTLQENHFQKNSPFQFEKIQCEIQLQNFSIISAGI